MRRRLVLAAALAVLVAGGGIALERVVGPAPPTGPPSSEAVSSARFCPHGGGGGWRVWVSLANPGADEAEVVLTTLGPAEPAAKRLQLAPRSLQQVEVTATEMGAGTLVESFGAEIAAGFVATRPEGGAAAEPCLARSARRWFLPDGTSERGQRAWAVVMNPFAIDAVFDVLLVRPDSVSRPSGLRGIVLPARRAVALDLNGFALGERSLGSMLEVSSGRVVAGSIGTGEERGLRAAVGSATLGRTWLLPGALDDGPGVLLTMARAADVPLRARALGADTQTELIADATIPAGLSAAFDLQAPGASLVASSEGRAPFAAARRSFSVGANDAASTGGAGHTSARWVVLPALGPDGGSSFLILQNPGAQEVRVRLQALSPSGPIEIPGLGQATVPAGRSAALDLGLPLDGRSVAVVVEAIGGELVAAQASQGPAGYAIAIGERG